MKRIETRRKGRKKKKVTPKEIINGEMVEIETLEARFKSIKKQGQVQLLSARNILISIMLGVIAT